MKRKTQSFQKVLNCSEGQEVFGFDNTAETFFKKIAKKFHLKIRKCKRILYFPIKIFFSLNFSYEHLESSFENAAKN